MLRRLIRILGVKELWVELKKPCSHIPHFLSLWPSLVRPHVPVQQPSCGHYHVPTTVFVKIYVSFNVQQPSVRGMCHFPSVSVELRTDAQSWNFLDAPQVFAALLAWGWDMASWESHLTEVHAVVIQKRTRQRSAPFQKSWFNIPLTCSEPETEPLYLHTALGREKLCLSDRVGEGKNTERWRIKS